MHLYRYFLTIYTLLFQDSHGLFSSDAPILHVNGPGSSPNKNQTLSVDTKFNILATNTDDISITVGSPHKVLTNLETFVNYSVETDVSFSFYSLNSLC